MLTTGFTCGGWLPAIDPALANLTPCPFQPGTDSFYMFHALVAGQSRGAISSPNPAVGCVVVKDGSIISRGCTQAWGHWHAEREAFDSVSKRDMAQATVYVTLEPCHHQGRQPPCTDLFQQKPPRRVVIACLDPNPLTQGQGMQALQDLGIEVVLGVLQKEAQAWHGPFLNSIHQPERPFVALKWAQSLDGAFALCTGGPYPITGALARTYNHWLRQKYDVILVGAGTVLDDAPQLDVRLLNPSSNVRPPIKVIMDFQGRFVLPSSHEGHLKKRAAGLQQTCAKGSKTFVVVSPSVAEQLTTLPQNDLLWTLIQQGQCYPLIFEGPLKKATTFRKEELMHQTMDVLHQSTTLRQALGRPLQSVLVEGGPRLHSLFLSENLFDALHIFVGPWLLGMSPYRLFEETTKMPVHRRDQGQRCSLLQSIALEDDVLCEYTACF